MQLQIPWVKPHQSWMWKLWSLSWTESMWDQQEELMLINPVVAVTNEEIHKQVWETAVQARATHMHVNLHVTDWVAAQQEDSSTVRLWLSGSSNQKVQDLKHLLGDDTKTEEGMAILQEWKKLMLYQGALYHSSYTGWRAGRSYVVHSPQGSPSGCY